jgi:hypothetical protein
MSKEERLEATVTEMQELADIREVKALARQNVPISAFNDTRATLEKIQTEVCFFITFSLSK